MTRFFLTLLSGLFILSGLQAQSPFDNARVNGSFQVDAQFYRPDKAIGISDSTIDGRKVGINGYGNINYTLGNFSAGMRYEAFLGPIAGYDPRHEGNGFPYIWAAYQTEMIEVTIGNYYEQFGNGLVLRSYEEWALGYDNSLNGMRVVYRPLKGLTLKGVYGTQRFYWQKFERNNRGTVRGTDVEADLNQLFPALDNGKVRILLGGSAVSKYQRDADPIYNLPENVAAFAGRVNLSAGKFSFMTEYAHKINDPSALNNYIYKEGQALLSSLSYSQRGLGVILQLKRVDNMYFKSDRSATANTLDIGFIPPINRTHAYSLTGKYPYATQPNGEMGMQFQLNYQIPRGSKLGGKYGTGVAINFSQVNDINRLQIDTIPVNTDGTLGYESKFFDVSDKVFFRDFNIEIDKRINSKLKTVVQYMNLYYDIATIEGKPGKEAVKANIFLADVTYRITTRNSLRLELQGMFTEQDEGDWAAAMLEYTVAPNWFFAIADQYNFGNPLVADRKHYYTASMGYTREATRLALTFGRQAEGVICVGGVCRVVPASSGLSLTLTTNF